MFFLNFAFQEASNDESRGVKRVWADKKKRVENVAEYAGEGYG